MDVFQYAALAESLFERKAAETGYKRITTFYSDLSIAEWIGGGEGVKSTYNDIVREWMDDCKFFTEFVLSLNWKSWEWYERSEISKYASQKEEAREISEVYANLFYEARDKFYEHFKDDKDALHYFFEVTD